MINFSQSLIHLLFFLLSLSWKVLSGSSSYSSKPFSRCPWINFIIRAKSFSPAFLKQQNPNLISMWLCIYWFRILTRKHIISTENFPLTINKQFNCIEMSRIGRKQKSLWNDLWVNWYYRGYATQKIAISNLPLNNIFWFYLSSQSNSAFLSMQYWCSHLKYLEFVWLEYNICRFILSNTCFRILIVNESLLIVK